MLVHIENQFLFALTNKVLTYSIDTFQDNGCEYVKSLQIVTNKECISSMNKDNINDVYLNSLYQVIESPAKFLAVKDLKGYIQSCYPNSKISIIMTSSLN